MAKTSAGKQWSQPADVREAVVRRWSILLTAFLTGQEWVPFNVLLRGPGPSEIAERLAEVQAWVAEWERAGRGPLRVEYKQVGGRLVGTNQIPCRAWLDGYAQAWDLLGARRQVSELSRLAERAKEECPRVLSWLERSPVSALRLAADWERLLATVRWIDEHQLTGRYVRQVDVPGVDTKFIESHERVLTQLLDLQLDPTRINPSASGFAGRYGFRRKPEYVRFRHVNPASPYTEMTVRVDELTAAPEGVSRAFILENEVTYLAFPLAADAIVLFGDGYAVSTLAKLGWLGTLDLTYWGDLDTHGFAILNRLRSRFPHARSILMDRETLLAHQSQWVTEKVPTKAGLSLLTPLEEHLYQDLIQGTFGPAVRLEQERVSFTSLEHVLSSAWPPPEVTAAPNLPDITHRRGRRRRLLLPVPPHVARQLDEADDHQDAGPFDQQANEDGDDGGPVAVDQCPAQAPSPGRLADLERLAERDLVRPGRLQPGAAGLHDAVGGGLAAVLIAAGLVRERVEGDGVLGAGQVGHPVDDGGHADHGYPQDQHHPGPAEEPQDPVPVG
jgi:hypothetical protein